MDQLIRLQKEKTMIEEAQKDPEKFGALYDLYFDQIYRYIYRRVGQKDAVYDLTSQTFFDALSHIKNFEWRGYSFSSWLYKIAHNNVLKWYRDNTKVHLTDLVEGETIPDQNINHPEELQKRQTQAEVQKVLKQLNSEEREIIRLKFFEEVSNIEMAEILGVSPNHIGVKVFRALQRVKQLLTNSL